MVNHVLEGTEVSPSTEEALEIAEAFCFLDLASLASEDPPTAREIAEALKRIADRVVAKEILPKHWEPDRTTEQFERLSGLLADFLVTGS